MSPRAGPPRLAVRSCCGGPAGGGGGPDADPRVAEVRHARRAGRLRRRPRPPRRRPRTPTPSTSSGRAWVGKAETAPAPTPCPERAAPGRPCSSRGGAGARLPGARGGRAPTTPAAQLAIAELLAPHALRGGARRAAAARRGAPPADQPSTGSSRPTRDALQADPAGTTAAVEGLIDFATPRRTPRRPTAASRSWCGGAARTRTCWCASGTSWPDPGATPRPRSRQYAQALIWRPDDDGDPAQDGRHPPRRRRWRVSRSSCSTRRRRPAARGPQSTSCDPGSPQARRLRGGRGAALARSRAVGESAVSQVGRAARAGCGRPRCRPRRSRRSPAAFPRRRTG